MLGRVGWLAWQRIGLSSRRDIGAVGDGRDSHALSVWIVGLLRLSWLGDVVLFNLLLLHLVHVAKHLVLADSGLGHVGRMVVA